LGGEQGFDGVDAMRNGGHGASGFAARVAGVVWGVKAGSVGFG
jgi:hypothetical protein